MIFSSCTLLWAALSIIYISSGLYFQLLLLDSSAVRYRRLAAVKNSLYIIDLNVVYFFYSDITTEPSFSDGQLLDIVRSFVLFAVDKATVI